MIPEASEEHFGPYTWEDFVKLPDDDRRELIDGHLVETEVPSFAHEAIVMLLGYHLHAWSRARGEGLTLGSGAKVRISKKRGVMPDAQFYRPVPGAPKSRPFLVVEIISPSSRRYDRVIKLHYYASKEVPEYWIIDPEARALERLVLVEGRYLIADALAEDEMLKPSSFEGLEISLAELWDAAERARSVEDESE